MLLSQSNNNNCEAATYTYLPYLYLISSFCFVILTYIERGEFQIYLTNINGDGYREINPPLIYPWW